MRELAPLLERGAALLDKAFGCLVIAGEELDVRSERRVVGRDVHRPGEVLVDRPRAQDERARIAEPALHCFEAGEKADDVRLSATVDSVEQLATASDGIRYGGRTVVEACAELLDAWCDGPARLPEVQDGPLRSLLGLAVLAVQAAAHEGEHIPDPSERSCVAELFEQREALCGQPDQRLRAALGLPEEVQVRELETRAHLCPALVGRDGRVEGGCQRLLRSPDFTRPPEDEPELYKQVAANDLFGIEQRRGARQQVGCAVGVARFRGAQAGSRQPASAVGSEAVGMAVRPSGAHPAPVSLLEVVTGELVLDPALEVQPVDEAFVELRARLLRYGVVGDLADQDVVEAEGILALGRRVAGLDETLVRQLEQDAPDCRHVDGRREVEHGSVPEVATDDGRALEHRPLLFAEQVEATRDERVDRRGHCRQRRSPALACERDQLLREQRIATGKLRDLGLLFVLEPTARALDQRGGFFGAQRR